MAEINEGRHPVTKGDFGGTYSDADSGYDDPGVITIPVVRTVFRNDSDGRKTSTTSTEWISVNKNSEMNGLGSNASSTTSLGSPKGALIEAGPEQPSAFPNLMNDSGALSNFIITSSDPDCFEISQFTKEHGKESDSERRLRFLSMPRGQRGIARPTIRDISSTNKIVLKEETTKRVPRRRIRSKSADSRRPKGSQNLFSPTYSKILSPESMRNRKMWADVVRKDCILEEEYYKVPYEECNREIILGRFCSSETLLNNFKRLKKQNMSDGIPDIGIGKKNKNDTLFSMNQPDNKSKRNESNQCVINNNKYSNGEANFPSKELNNKFDFNALLPNTSLLQPGNTPITSTDQIQQLIDDLNLFAFPIPKAGLETLNATDDSDNTQLKSFPLESNDRSTNPLSKSSSILNEMPSLIGEGGEAPSVDSNSKQARKKKNKKKVSFSNENEELIFDSTFSDSDSSSSVFEDKNEVDAGGLQKPANHCERNYSPYKYNDSLNHDSFEGNTINSHDLKLITPEQRSNSGFGSNNLGNKNSFNSKLNTKTHYDDKLYSPYLINSIIKVQNAIKEKKKMEKLGLEKHNGDIISNNIENISNNNKLEGSANVKTENIEIYNDLPSKNKKENGHKKKKTKFNTSSILNGDTTVHNIENISNNRRNEDASNAHTENIEIYNGIPSDNKKENVHKKKKTKPNTSKNPKGDKINIFMTKGPSFTNHQIHLLTNTSSQKPNVSVSRIMVPFSTIRDQWEWALMLQKQTNTNIFRDNGGTPILESSPPLIDHMKECISPTPSSESSLSSGCFSAPSSPPTSPFRNNSNKGLLPTEL